MKSTRKPARPVAPATVTSLTVDTLSEQSISERIVSAVMEHRLPAGTKLGEIALSESFGTTRQRIRRVLLILAERGIVELHANRGAFVASPNREDARNVFQARCTIEPTIVRNAIHRISDRQIGKLVDLVRQEEAASKAGRRHDMIRLSGQFHVALAEFAGNSVLQRFVEDLVARSSLIIGLFGSTRLTHCSADEHSLLIEAIRDRNLEGAPGAMVEHLKHIESALELNDKSEAPVDLKSIFGA